MADIKCPKCGGVTTIRTAKNDDGQFYVCVKYPKCAGMVPVEEDLGADWDEERPLPEFDVVSLEWPEPALISDKEVTKGKTGRDKRSFDAGEQYAVSGEQAPAEEDWSGGWGQVETTKGKPKRDKRRVDAGAKKPERKEAAPVEEDWSGGWGAESPAPKAAHFKLLQRREPSPRKEKPEAVEGKAKQAKRGLASGVKDDARKGPVSVEEDWNGSWGAESPAPKIAQEIPQQRKEPVTTEVGSIVARKTVRDKRVSDTGAKHAGPEKKVPAEGWGADWGTESAATKPVPDKRRGQQELSLRKVEAETAVPKSEKAQRKTRSVITRTGRQGRAIIDKGLGIGEEEKPISEAVTGRDGRQIESREIMSFKGKELSTPRRPKAPKTDSFAPQYKRLPKTFVVPEEEAPYVPPQRKLVKREAYPETKAPLEPIGQKEAKPVPHGAYRRKPKPAPVLPQEPEKPGPAPYKPLYQRPSRLEMASEEKQLELQGLGESTPAPYRPQYRRMPKPAYVPPQDPGGLPPTPYRPQYPRAQKRALYSEKQEAPKPRRRKAK